MAILIGLQKGSRALNYTAVAISMDFCLQSTALVGVACGPLLAIDGSLPLCMALQHTRHTDVGLECLGKEERATQGTVQGVFCWPLNDEVEVGIEVNMALSGPTNIAP